MKELEEKIDKLQKAIDSPATPEAQKVLFRETLEKYENQLQQLIAKEEAGIRNKGKLLDAFFKVVPFDTAFSIKDSGGYAILEKDALSEDGTEITINVSGESPILDTDDSKKITQSVKKLLGLDAKVNVSGTDYLVTYTKSNVEIKENTVTGSFTLKLSDTLKQ